MDFDLGMAVYSRDDVRVGTIDRIVLRQFGGPVQSLVVHKGAFFSRDVLVPLEYVRSVDDLGIHLSLSEGELERLPSFLEEQYAAPPDDTVLPTYTMGGVMFPLGTEPGVAPLIVGEVKNLPPGADDIAQGYTVLSADGADVGTIRDVQVAAESGLITFLIIEQVAQDDAGNAEDLGLLRVPASAVDHITNDVVTLSVTSAELLAGSS